RDQGIKVSHVPLDKLQHEARAYLATHPEVIEEARARSAAEALIRQANLCAYLLNENGGQNGNDRVRSRQHGRQTLDAQQAALKAAGAERVYAEKISGAVTDRKQLAKAIGALGPEDVLLVSRLDRLARSTRDLLNVLAQITEAGAGFRSLADAWADTTTAHGRLMLTVLGGLAEFERELIRARTD